MSFIDDIVDGAGDLFSAGVDYLKGDGIGSSLARVALLGAGVNAISKMVNSSNSTPTTAKETEPDRGARLQVPPDPTHKIPVVCRIMNAVCSEVKRSARAIKSPSFSRFSSSLTITNPPAR